MSSPKRFMNSLCTDCPGKFCGCRASSRRNSEYLGSTFSKAAVCLASPIFARTTMTSEVSLCKKASISSSTRARGTSNNSLHTHNLLLFSKSAQMGKSKARMPSSSCCWMFKFCFWMPSTENVPAVACVPLSKANEALACVPGRVMSSNFRSLTLWCAIQRGRCQSLSVISCQVCVKSRLMPVVPNFFMQNSGLSCNMQSLLCSSIRNFTLLLTCAFGVAALASDDSDLTMYGVAA
mmetsp:Transcript_2901/g.7535  ORF Transcript_2901/g.7535 Transcript_2901/m.7535 type:complete len:236 (+) Transcript_2901:1661-2368(+)